MKAQFCINGLQLIRLPRYELDVIEGLSLAYERITELEYTEPWYEWKRWIPVSQDVSWIELDFPNHDPYHVGIPLVEVLRQLG